MTLPRLITSLLLVYLVFCVRETVMPSGPVWWPAFNTALCVSVLVVRWFLAEPDDCRGAA